jgi:predicted hydrocarbon binding protein
MKTQEIFIPVIYTGTVARVIQKLGDKAPEILKELGIRMAETILKIWKPKKNSTEGIVQEIYKEILLKKPQIEKQAGGTRLIVKDEDCVLCWNVQAKIHYCIPIGVILETVINKYSQDKVQVETTKSKAMGADQCEHVINVIGVEE